MRRTFIELPQFQDFIDKSTDKELLRKIQEEILANPTRGDIICGSGGVRKDRYLNPDLGKGKRSGLRYLFLDLSNIEKTYLIGIYSKGTKINISQDEKKSIKRLVQVLKKEAR